VNRAGVILLGLLVVQLGILALLHREEMNSNGSVASSALVDTGAYVVDQISIADTQGTSLQLQRVGDQWLLPALNSLPADAQRVNRLLQQLTNQDPGWSVAHSLAARQRFQVAHYHFRRKLVLSALERTVATVFLGTSPGFRKVHARSDDADNIYTLDLNLFDLPVEPGKWLDSRLLQVRTPMAITADGYSLRRNADEWRLGSGAAPDQRELQALLDALRNLQVQDIAAAEIEAALAGKEAALILQVEALAGTVTLQLFAHQQQHFIRSSEYPYLFRISTYEFDQLTGIDSFLLSHAQ
jgi:hypothetical protein